MKKKKRILWYIIFFIFGTIFIKQSIIIYRLNKQYKQYSEKLEKTKMINTQLKDKLNEAKSSDYIEKLAREKLGLVKPGEVLFIDKNKKR